jgi:hypothetical protein
MTTASSPASGWYPAPDGQPYQRWWDGQQWTDATAPIASAAGSDPGPRKAVTYEHKRTSHGLHLFMTIITAGAWGLLVWVPITILHRVTRGEKVVTRYR